MPIVKAMGRAGALAAAAGFLLAPGGAGGQVSVTCLGDSVTHGYPYADSGHPELAYPARLQSLLDGAYGEGAFAVLNRGVNGYQAEDLVGDLLEPDALAENPAYVLLMIGGNDLAWAEESTIVQIVAETTWEVQSCVDLARGHLNPDGSRPKVIVSAFIPNRLEGALGSLAVGYFNASLAANLSGYDLWFTANWDDLYDSATGMAKAGLMYDAVHPNGDGYAELGQNWREALAVLLPSPTTAPSATPAPSVPPPSPTPSVEPPASVSPTPTPTPPPTPPATLTPPPPTATPSPRATGTLTPPVPTRTATPAPSPSPSPSCGPQAAIDRSAIASGDYNGDGRSDIAVFRPSAGSWSIQNLSRVYFGAPDDFPAPGDYNGDGTAEIAVFRPSGNVWSIRNLTRAYYGGASDLPVPGDYDGDGTAEIGIFRETSGQWLIRDLTRFYFGATGDWPIPGDYGDDGTAEAGLYRVSSGQWMIRDLSRFYFGGAADWPVPGDYLDSSGKVFAVYRPCPGQWALKDLTRIYFGNCFDYPRPADYDGDGKDDFGIFRDSAGMWSVRDLTRVYFGSTGDIPATR